MWSAILRHREAADLVEGHPELPERLFDVGPDPVLEGHELTPPGFEDLVPGRPKPLQARRHDLALNPLVELFPGSALADG